MIKNYFGVVLLIALFSHASAYVVSNAYCPEAIPGGYEHKFSVQSCGSYTEWGSCIDPDTYMWSLIITGDIEPDGYCEETATTRGYTPTLEPGYKMTGDAATIGLGQFEVVKLSEGTMSCKVTSKKLCVNYAGGQECGDALALNPELVSPSVEIELKAVITCNFPDSYGMKDDDYINYLARTTIRYAPPDAPPTIAHGGGDDICGDYVCDSTIGENCFTCPNDCSCTPGELCSPNDLSADPTGCVESQVSCGDGACDPGEDCSNCPLDCGVCKEVCDNGVDDDADAKIDCADDGCKGSPWCGFKVTGQLKTGSGRPLKNVGVWIYKDGNKVIGNYTDENGNIVLDYSRSVQSLGIPVNKPEVTLHVALEDKDGQFQIMWDLDSENKLYRLDTTRFILPTPKHFDLTLRKDNPIWSQDSKVINEGWDTHWDAGEIYYDAMRAFEFAKKKLGYAFDGGGNSLPLKVFIYSDYAEGGALYEPNDRGGGIFMSPKASRHDDSQCPENCIWHEFFHFALYNKYAGWSSYGSMGKNHAGFKNNNTGDSYEEGFAEFWPLVMSKELDGATDAVYGGAWNLELNYNPWVKHGTYEELAFASLLWDIVDSKQDKGDELTIPYKNLWDVLMSNSFRSVEEVYLDLRGRWTEVGDEINELFIAHGFFKDTLKGNGQYDYGEPFWDLDPDGSGAQKPNLQRDANEDFIDIGTPDDGIGRPHQVYTPGEDWVGTSSNYQRPGRKNKPLDPYGFVKVDTLSNGVPVNDTLFKVTYEFSDPSLNYVSYGIVDPETGYAYVELPPYEYQATATITADNYMGTESVQVTNDDYYSPENAGYMKQATVEVGQKKTDYCNSNGICERVESPLCGDCPAPLAPIAQPTGCTTDFDCGSNEVCQGGQCVTVSPPAGITYTTPGEDMGAILVVVVIIVAIFAILIAVVKMRGGSAKKPPEEQAPQTPQPQGNTLVINQ